VRPLGQRLGALHAQAVDVQHTFVLALDAQPLGQIRGAVADRDDLEDRHVRPAALDGREVGAQAEPEEIRLAGGSETEPGRRTKAQEGPRPATIRSCVWRLASGVWRLACFLFSASWRPWRAWRFVFGLGPWVVDEQVVALGPGGEVAVDDARLEPAL